MKCPTCSAELMPVDGEMFCLQCGRVVSLKPGEDGHGPPLENTQDPVLQRAIQEVSDHPVKFRAAMAAATKLPVADAKPEAVKSFGSLHKLVGGPRPALAGAGAGPGSSVAMAPAVPAVTVPAKAEPAKTVLPKVQEQPAPKVIPKPEPKPAQMVAAPKFGTAGINLLTQRAKAPAGLGLASPAVALAVAGLAFFVVINIAIAVAFTGRVYPGVHVGQLSVGGMSGARMANLLSHELKPLGLTATVGGSVYAMQAPGLGRVDLVAVEQRAISVGRGAPLPLVGLVQAWLSRPVAVTYSGTDVEVSQAVKALAVQVDHAPTPALPLVVNGQVFVIGEKAGDQLDVPKAEAAVRGALAGEGAQIAAPVSQTKPVVTADDYQNDVTAAQARMGLSIKISVKTAVYSPTATQIGSWLVFSGPGKGATADPAQVAAYVAGLPGRFDRAGTTAALLSALNGGQALNYVPSTRKVTPAPAETATAAAWPLETLKYCLAADSGTVTSAQAAQVAAALNAPADWGLGGRLKFAVVTSGCNFSVRLVAPAAMGQLDPACAGQTTCNVGNQIEISTASYAKAPVGWSGSVVAYDNELVDHEAGHWLGFTHTSCTSKAAPVPILQAPTLVLNGCSPNWYEVPGNVAGTKVLPGF